MMNAEKQRSKALGKAGNLARRVGGAWVPSQQRGGFGRFPEPLYLWVHEKEHEYAWRNRLEALPLPAEYEAPASAASRPYHQFMAQVAQEQPWLEDELEFQEYRRKKELPGMGPGYGA